MDDDMPDGKPGRRWDGPGAGIGIGVAIGVGVGALLGVALDDMAYMGVGIALGVALGAAFEQRGSDDGGGAGD